MYETDLDKVGARVFFYKFNDKISPEWGNDWY